MADVYGAAAACTRSQCQLTQALGLYSQAQKLYDQLLQQNDRSHMSQALWCDSGGHAFSERDPGRQRITVNNLDEDTGKETTEARDFCGDCAERAGLLARKVTRPAVLAPAADDRL